MKKTSIMVSLFALSGLNSYSQETLQTVTDRGNTTSNRISLDPVYQFGSRITAYGAGNGYFDIYNNSNSSISLALKRSDGASVFEIDGHSMNAYFGGNVGIGTMSPKKKLHIYQDPDQTGLIIQGNTINPDGAGHFVAITLDGDYGDATGNNSQIRSYSNLHNFWGSSLAFFTTSNTASHVVSERMRIDAAGNVGIGTSIPTERLSVKGKIRAQEIKVENTNWPDFVFAKTYKLQTLQETETHIKKEGHLPGIPTAADVKANGVDLGEMNARLLQKIEELTLHLIELKHENNAIKEKLVKQQITMSKIIKKLK